MIITLKPILHSATDDIRVEDELFAIGRSTTPFNGLPKNQAMQLSRRHAKIFEEQGKLYIVDLGSRNGTRLNGRPLADQPELLKSNDEIMFGNLCYELQNHSEYAQPSRVEPCPFRLILKSQSARLKEASIIISDFPCLFSKSTGVISEYCHRFQAETKYLSRRHAHVFINHNQLWLEDLGSTNGSHINEQQLQEQAQPLKDGDKLQLGKSKDLIFLVSISSTELEVTEFLGDRSQIASQNESPADPSQTSIQSQSEADQSLAPGTVLLDKANTFLDIFCDKPKDDPDLDDSANQAVQNKSKHLRKKLKKENWFSAFFRPEPTEQPYSPGKSRKILLSLLPVIAISIAGVFYFSNSTKNQIQELYDKTHYKEAVVLANKSLRKMPDDETLQQLSSLATIKWLAKIWLQPFNNGNYPQAKQHLQQVMPIISTNMEMKQLVAVLIWATELEQLMSNMQNGQAVEIYGNERRIRDIISTWENNPLTNQHYLGLVTQHIPEFGSTQSTLLSHLRALKNSQSVYLNAIDLLRNNINQALNQNQIGLLAQMLKDFTQKYPNIKGVGKLEQDLDLYSNMLQLKNESRLLELVGLLNEAHFVTPLFQQQAKTQIDAKLPAPDVIERYIFVENAWREGDLVTAIKMAGILAEEPWGQVASAWLNHYDIIISGYEDLLDMRQSANYNSQLLLFHAKLDPQLDLFFLEQLEPEIIPIRQKVLTDAQLDFQKAENFWLSYQQHGGINGIMRLEETSSQQYRARATELSTAFKLAQTAKQRMDSLAIKPKPSETELVHHISDEITHQRNGLENLRRVLGSGLTNKKLQQLPVLAK